MRVRALYRHKVENGPALLVFRTVTAQSDFRFDHAICGLANNDDDDPHSANAVPCQRGEAPNSAAQKLSSPVS